MLVTKVITIAKRETKPYLLEPCFKMRLGLQIKLLVVPDLSQRNHKNRITMMLPIAPAKKLVYYGNGKSRAFFYVHDITSNNQFHTWRKIQETGWNNFIFLKFLYTAHSAGFIE
jgi:hypothetical protein